MENTLENKAKFFAQYWGQNVRFWTLNGSDILQKVAHTYMTKAIIESSTLELKPLSSISDEDAIEVAKIVCPEMFINTGGDPIKIERQGEWITVWRKRNVHSVDIDFLGYTTCQNEEVEYKRNSVGNTLAIDYLRSKGYALPWMGLSEEKQIEYGWVKLKGETKK